MEIFSISIISPSDKACLRTFCVLVFFHRICLIFGKYNLRKIYLDQLLAKYNPCEIVKNWSSVKVNPREKSKICVLSFCKVVCRVCPMMCRFSDCGCVCVILS